MPAPDQILWGLDRQISELRLELRLMRQEAQFERKLLSNRIEALEEKAKSAPKTPTLIALNERHVTKISLFIAFLMASIAAGKPFLPAIATALTGKPGL